MESNSNHQRQHHEETEEYHHTYYQNQQKQKLQTNHRQQIEQHQQQIKSPRYSNDVTSSTVPGVIASVPSSEDCQFSRIINNKLLAFSPSTGTPRISTYSNKNNCDGDDLKIVRQAFEINEYDLPHAQSPDRTLKNVVSKNEVTQLDLRIASKVAMNSPSLSKRKKASTRINKNSDTHIEAEDYVASGNESFSSFSSPRKSSIDSRDTTTAASLVEQLDQKIATKVATMNSPSLRKKSGGILSTVPHSDSRNSTCINTPERLGSVRAEGQSLSDASNKTLINSLGGLRSTTGSPENLDHRIATKVLMNSPIKRRDHVASELFLSLSPLQPSNENNDNNDRNLCMTNFSCSTRLEQVAAKLDSLQGLYVSSSCNVEGNNGDCNLTHNDYYSEERLIEIIDDEGVNDDVNFIFEKKERAAAICDIVPSTTNDSKIFDSNGNVVNDSDRKGMKQHVSSGSSEDISESLSVLPFVVKTELDTGDMKQDIKRLDDDIENEQLVIAIPVNEMDDSHEQEQRHMKLPKAIELDIDSKGRKGMLSKRQRRRVRMIRCASLMVGFLLTTAFVGMIIGILLVDSKTNKANSPELSDMTWNPREHLGIEEIIRSSLLPIFTNNASLNATTNSDDNNTLILLTDPTSPYYKAVRWMIYNDPLQLVPTNETFFRRYLLVYLYFSLSTTQEWSTCAPLTTDAVTLFGSSWLDSNKSVNYTKNVESSLSIDHSENSSDSNNNNNKNMIKPPRCRPGVTQAKWDIVYDYNRKDAAHWLSDADECKWGGVECDDYGHVLRLEINSMNITGSFPEGIVLAPFLREIALTNGKLKGGISPLVPKMKYIDRIELRSNPSLMTSAGMPSELYHIRHLTHINLIDTDLGGSIPKSVSKLKDLRRIYFSVNQITGILPFELFEIRSINELHIEENALKGSIPSYIGNLRKLEELVLHKNQLTGSIPSEIGLNMELISLKLSWNLMTGTIPNELYSLPNMYSLFLDENSFNGTISTMIGNLTELDEVSFVGNDLVGTVPTELGTIKGMRRIQLQNNSFNGEMPTELCSLRTAGTLLALEANCLPSNAPINNWNDSNIESAPVAGLECASDCCTLCCHPNENEC